MPYGTAHKTTLEYLQKRLNSYNESKSISLERLRFADLGIDQFVHENECDYIVSRGEEECSCSGVNTFEISVIFDGALDEEFYISPSTDHEFIARTVGDWIAEQCAEEAKKNAEANPEHQSTWEVVVATPGGEGADGTVLLRRENSAPPE